MMRSLTPFLSIVIAVLLFVFFTNPQYAKVSALDTEIDKYHDAVVQYEEFSRKLDEKLRIKESRSMEESERLDTLVPTTIDNTRLLVDLEAMVERHDMLFGNISLSGGDTELTERDENGEATDESPELTTVDVSFQVIGTYEQFKSLLRDLESSLTLYEVTRIGFTASAGNLQQFGITVRAYALPSNN